MNDFSKLFFWLAPFGLFCSRVVNGFVLCAIFIILGFVFKWIEDNVNTIKIDPKELWELRYKDRMRYVVWEKASISDEVMAREDKEARGWATAVCDCHGAWIPPKETQEEIARAYGVVTEQMVKEKAEKKDRIQIGKYYLMRELKLKYEKTWYIRKEIEKDMRKIKMSYHSDADDWSVEKRYGKTIKEMWGTFSPEEKQRATDWIKEYEKKLTVAIRDYEERKSFVVQSVNMDF